MGNAQLKRSLYRKLLQNFYNEFTDLNHRMSILNLI
jgi:hypothetical protein